MAAEQETDLEVNIKIHNSIASKSNKYVACDECPEYFPITAEILKSGASIITNLLVVEK